MKNAGRPSVFWSDFVFVIALITLSLTIFLYGQAQDWSFLESSASSPALQWEDFVQLLDRCETGSSKFEYCQTALRVVIKDLPHNAHFKKTKLKQLEKIARTPDLQVFARNLRNDLEPLQERRWTLRALNVWLKNIDPFSSLTDRNEDGLETSSLTVSKASKAVRSLRLKDFSSKDLCRDVERHVKAYENDDSVQSVRIDLRGNPGGLIDQALCIGNLFVDRGELMLQLRRKKIDWPFEVESSWVISALDLFSQRTISRYAEKPRVFSKKVEVWIDHKSASAAEILASILQDKADATVVGEKSYGKSVVQLPQEVHQWKGIKAHLTVFEWFRPSEAYAAENTYSGVQPHRRNF